MAGRRRPPQHALTPADQPESDEQAGVLVRGHRVEEATHAREAHHRRVGPAEHRQTQRRRVEELQGPHERVVDRHGVHERQLVRRPLRLALEAQPHHLRPRRRLVDRHAPHGEVPRRRPGDRRLHEHREGVVRAGRQRHHHEVRPGQGRRPIRPVTAQHHDHGAPGLPHRPHRIDGILLRTRHRAADPLQLDPTDRVRGASDDPVRVVVDHEAARPRLACAQHHPADDVDLLLERHPGGGGRRPANVRARPGVDHDPDRGGLVLLVGLRHGTGPYRCRSEARLVRRVRPAGRKPRLPGT